uniref:Uncharacterized protein n=1 Tax=Arundo donax TaxID=35708 RepID=A0A0A8ZAA3_ARUDO
MNLVMYINCLLTLNSLEKGCPVSAFLL